MGISSFARVPSSGATFCGRHAGRRTLRLAQDCPGHVCREGGRKLLRLRRNCHPHSGAPPKSVAFRGTRVGVQPALMEWSRCRRAVQGVRTTSMCSSPQHEPQTQNMERVDQQKFSERILRRKEYATTSSTHWRSRRISTRGVHRCVFSLCVCVWACVLRCVCEFPDAKTTSDVQNYQQSGPK